MALTATLAELGRWRAGDDDCGARRAPDPHCQGRAAATLRRSLFGAPLLVHRALCCPLREPSGRRGFLASTCASRPTMVGAGGARLLALMRTVLPGVVISGPRGDRFGRFPGSLARAVPVR